MIKVFLYGGEGIGSSIDDDMVYLKNMLATRENIKLVKAPLFADIVHIVWWNQFKKIKNFKRISTAKWIAVASNEIQDNNKDFVEAENIVDYWISYNKKQHEWFLNKSLKSFLMPLYVDKNIFYSNENSKVEMANSLGIDINLIQNRKLIGSFQRDSNGSNLFLPKWQKNPELLVDILIALRDRVGDKNWCLILAGPRRHWILNSCVENKIPFVYVKELRVTSSYKYRNILEAKFKINNKELYLFINHWKAKSGPESKRIISAKVLQIYT